MNLVEDILLVKWLEGSASHDELDLISRDFDLGQLDQYLSHLEQLRSNSKSTLQSWDDLQLKIQSLQLKPTPRHKRPKLNLDHC